jgi:hypothetical protein
LVVVFGASWLTGAETHRAQLSGRGIEIRLVQEAGRKTLPRKNTGEPTSA